MTVIKRIAYLTAALLAAAASAPAGAATASVATIACPRMNDLLEVWKVAIADQDMGALEALQRGCESVDLGTEFDVVKQMGPITRISDGATELFLLSAAIKNDSKPVKSAKRS